VTELRAGSATDVGRVRANNQDELLVATPLFAVADGMGGAAAGEVASATAIPALRDAFAGAGESTPEHLLQAAQAANRAVWDQAEANPEMRGMGTTLVALAQVGDGQLAAINIGDSRLYQLHEGELRQVTSDHNLVAELVAEGRLSKEDAEFHPRRNIMTRALGVEPEVPVDEFLLDASPGDRLLLCSDGLFRELSDDQIASLLLRLADPEEAADELVQEAKRKGGNDNITVVVVAVGSGEKGGDPTTAIAASASPEIVKRAKDPRPAGGGRRRAVPRPSTRFITLRVVGFLVLLLLLLGLAAAGVAWYARDGYFVGLKGSQIVIFRGQPGGLLWFHPTVAVTTGVTTSQVESYHLSALAAGQTEPSLAAARDLVASMVSEEQTVRQALIPPAPTTTLPAKTTPTTRPTS
jgi:protein phosphatase